jgi:hypothetical protein
MILLILMRYMQKTAIMALITGETKKDVLIDIFISAAQDPHSCRGIFPVWPVRDGTAR